jgi:uncharacterized repeat protein (TIGR01451 family)
MKQRLVRGVAVLGALFAAVAWGMPAIGAGADPLPEGVADFSVAVTSEPGIVAPAGSGVVYRITVSNSPVSIAADATTTGTLPAGFTYLSSTKDMLGNQRCSAVGATVTCSFPNVVPGVPQTVDVRAKTSAILGESYQFPVHVSSNIPVLEPLAYTGNNDATATTAVRAKVDDGTDSFVCGGCSVVFTDTRVGTAKVIVPASSNGVFVRMSVDTTFTGSNCGPDADPGAYVCNDALLLTYRETAEEPDYQANDPHDPIIVEYQPKQGACFGVGGSCAPLGYMDPSKGMTRPVPMEDCDGAGTGDNPGTYDAIVDGHYQICRDSSFKTSNKVTHRVLMKSTDPPIPPLSLPKV